MSYSRRARQFLSPIWLFSGAYCSNCEQRATKPLKRCGDCQHGFYCSANSQKAHWKKEHKKVCGKIKSLGSWESILSSTDRHDPNVIMKVLQDSDIFTNREDYFSTKVVAVTVFVVAATKILVKSMETIPHFETARIVPTDGTVTTQHDIIRLSELHYKHEDECQEILVFVKESQVPVAKERTFPTTNWMDYNRWRGFNGYIPDFYKANTQYMTCPMTALYAIAKMNVTVGRVFTIHIVNVDFATCFNSSGWEEVLHNFGSLVNLDLVFIGPDLKGLMSNQYQPIAMTCCDDCQAKGRRRQHATVATSYLDYLRDPRRINADLIFLPNSGYAENPLVSSVEVALVQAQNLPLCFTTFDKTEAADEVKLFKDVLMKRSCHENWDHIVINEPNPFYGMIPVIDSTAQGEEFFYFNSVVDMFRPRLQK